MFNEDEFHSGKMESPGDRWCRGWLIAQGGCRLEGKVYCFVTIKYPTHSRASSWRSFSKKNRIEEHRFENPALKFQM